MLVEQRCQGDRAHARAALLKKATASQSAQSLLHEWVQIRRVHNSMALSFRQRFIQIQQHIGHHHPSGQLPAVEFSMAWRRASLEKRFRRLRVAFETSPLLLEKSGQPLAFEFSRRTCQTEPERE